RQRDQQSERERDHRERERAWRRIPQEQRDELLLRALGGEGLTVREVTARLNAEVGSPAAEDGWATVPPSTVIQMAKRMLRVGHLERVGEQFQGKVRYRYFRHHASSEAVA